jgi:hypothetical protein
LFEGNPDKQEHAPEPLEVLKQLCIAEVFVYGEKLVIDEGSIFLDCMQQDKCKICR